MEFCSDRRLIMKQNIGLFIVVAGVLLLSACASLAPVNVSPVTVSTPRSGTFVVPRYESSYDVVASLWKENKIPDSVGSVLVLFQGNGSQSITDGDVGVILPLASIAGVDFQNVGQWCKGDLVNAFEPRPGVITVPMEASTKDSYFLQDCADHAPMHAKVYAVYAKTENNQARITWEEEMWVIQLSFPQ